MSKHENIGYDLIGDIHGQAIELKALLEKLGYQIVDGVHTHPTRKAIFLGDLVDRGAHQKEVIAIVRSMVKSGAALSVMGNHEFNAIAYFTDDGKGGYLRERNQKNRKTHEAFLEAYQDDPEEWRDVIEWFKTLPLWLDFDGLRVVHACWDREIISRIREYQGDSTLLSDELLRSACDKSSDWQYEAIEVILKGKEIALPEGVHFYDKDRTKRHEMRVRWWDDSSTTYMTAYMGPEQYRTHIPDDPIEGNHLVEYGHHEKPVFLGHYWLEGTPIPLADNIACLDYSVAKDGPLVAYRWSGEQVLNKGNYVMVPKER